MFKSLKQNLALYAFLVVAFGLLSFPVWSHLNQKADLRVINSEVSSIADKMQVGNEPLVGASGLFAQNASVQLNLEVMGTYASVSGNLSFNGEIMPDGVTCSNGEILKKTGSNNWDCAADADSGAAGAADSDVPFVTIGNTASLSFERALAVTSPLSLTDGGANGSATVGLASNSLNFDEFKNPLVLDANITTTSGSFTWDFGGANLVHIGSASFNRVLYINDTVNTKMTRGITINQGDADDFILSLKSSDIAHGMTDHAETDTYGHLSKSVAASGGLRVMGMTGANIGLSLEGMGVTDVTTKTTSSDAYIQLWAGKKSGTDIGDIGANANLAGFYNWTTGARLLIDAEGSIHIINGTDSDVDVVTVEVTGTPTLRWDESDDSFDLTKGLDITGYASLSTNLEVKNYASASQFFGGLSSHQFMGSITGDATNTLSLGSAVRFLKEIFSNIVRAANLLVSPAATGGAASGTVAGSLAVDTASRSLNYGDGTNENVHGRFDKCIGVSVDGSDLTAESMFEIFSAEDPYTVGLVVMKASGSNAAGWNLWTGGTSPDTKVFTLNKSASGSAQVKYSSFASAVVGDGETVYFHTASSSAVLDNFYVRVCLDKNP